MEMRDVTTKMGKMIISVKKHKGCSLGVLERVWFILS